VHEVAEHYDLPLVANERCGSWYIPPASKVGSAYFKSTDGHTGQWDFSFRRLNLQLLPLVSEHRGLVPTLLFLGSIWVYTVYGLRSFS
jgi:tRNA A64-2'-O-ribosylphosphate transferase